MSNGVARKLHRPFQILRLAPALREHLAGHLRRRAPGPDRAERRRQIHAAEDPRRPDRARFRLRLHAPQHARRLRAAGGRVPRGHTAARSHRRSHRPGRAPHLDEMERAARINQTLGRAGFTDGAVRTDALSGGWKRRLAIARETGARSPTSCSSTSPPTTSTSKASSGSKSCSPPPPFASVVVSHDRYFLENVVNDMAEIDRVYPDGLFRVEGSYSHFLEKQGGVPARAGQPPGGAAPTACAARWSGCAAAPRRAPANRRRASTRPAACMRELADLESRTVKGVAQIDFTATDRRTKRLVSRGGHRQGARRPHPLPRSQLHPHARHAARPARAERHRQDHAAAPAGRRDRRRTPAASSAPTTSASSTSTRRASSSTRARRSRQGLGAHGDYRHLPATARSTSPAGPSASSSIPTSSTGRWPASPAASRRAS